MACNIHEAINPPYWVDGDGVGINPAFGSKTCLLRDDWIGTGIFPGAGDFHRGYGTGCGTVAVRAGDGKSRKQ